MSPKISVVTVYVNDVPAAKTFYTDLLGFAVRAEPAPGMVLLQHDGIKLILAESANPSPAKYPQDGAVVLGIGTKDVNADVRALRAKGAKPLFPEAQPFPGGQFNAVRDPAGNVIELLEFSGA